MSNNTCPVFKGFISAWNDYPSQDNEGYRPERGSFKCGFYEGYRFAEGEIKQKDARIKELEVENEKLRQIFESVRNLDQYSAREAIEEICIKFQKARLDYELFKTKDKE